MSLLPVVELSRVHFKTWIHALDPNTAYSKRRGLILLLYFSNYSLFDFFNLVFLFNHFIWLHLVYC